MAILTTVFLVSAVLYTILCANVPVAVSPAAIHDDGFYIDSGRNIAAGNWLGRYSQYTLMKGPGFPLFLASISFLEIPVTVAQAVLYSIAVFLLSLVTLRLFRSIVLAVAVFELTLWNFGSDTGRIMREGIYPSQFLLSFSLLTLAFVLKRRWRYLLFGFSGLIFGWMWITREEGVTLLPTFGLLFLYLGWAAYNADGGHRAWLLPLALFVSAAGSIPLAISSINLRVYQTFSVVDVKAEFERALESLESIQADDKIPLVPISKKVREQAYRVSPTFAQLRELLDDPGSPAIVHWTYYGCGIYPKTCGDYVLGWFMWAFRDSAFIDGNYTSVASTSSFYRRIHDEIERACKTGTLTCSRSPLPFLPEIGTKQLRDMPKTAWSLLRKLLFVDPPFLLEQSSFGSVKQVAEAAQFLHVRNYSPPIDVRPKLPSSGPSWVAIGLKAIIFSLYHDLIPAVLLIGFVAFLLCGWKCVANRKCHVGFSWC